MSTIYYRSIYPSIHLGLVFHVPLSQDSRSGFDASPSGPGGCARRRPGLTGTGRLVVLVVRAVRCFRKVDD